jgi:hypothetical protein
MSCSSTSPTKQSPSQQMEPCNRVADMSNLKEGKEVSAADITLQGTRCLLNSFLRLYTREGGLRHQKDRGQFERTDASSWYAASFFGQDPACSHLFIEAGSDLTSRPVPIQSVQWGILSPLCAEPLFVPIYAALMYPNQELVLGPAC